MATGVPDDWSIEEQRQYTPQGREEPMEYGLYRHSTGDVRIRVAPTDLEGLDRPGYAIRVTIYPGLDIESSSLVRSVYRYERALELALECMAVFSSVYDGAGTVEEAAVYAARRIGDVHALDIDPIE